MEAVTSGQLFKERYSYHGEYSTDSAGEQIFHGQGILESISGEELRYSGEFSQGKFHGTGQLTEGTCYYSGEFKHGL